MTTIAVVIGDLSDSGSTWNYKKKLAKNLATVPGFTPLAVHTGGDTSLLPDNTEAVKVQSSMLPHFHRAEETYDIDLFHVQAAPLLIHGPARRSSAPVVSTFHGSWHRHWSLDMPQQFRAEYAPPRNIPLYKLSERLSKYTYVHAFTVSDWVREALIIGANYDPASVTTTYEAIDNRYFEEAQTTRPDEVPERYLFHVSYAGPRKNGQTLVHALDHLYDRIDTPIPLVIAGGGWESEIGQLVEQHGLTENVVFTGYVDESELVALYDHAECFVFPSFQENFGLPNVEAMARGTPVVTTDQAAIPEVVGDAAKIISDPLNGIALAEAIATVLNDNSIRESLVKRGYDRAQQFQWETHIRTVTEKYNSVLSGQ